MTKPATKKTAKPVDPFAAVKKKGANVTWTTRGGRVQTGRVFDTRENRGIWVEVNVAQPGKPRDIVLVRPKALSLAA